MPNCMNMHIHLPTYLTPLAALHVLALYVVALCLCHFVLSDSGGCARKRAAMSVKLTAVKRVQSSPNLLTAGITINHTVLRLDGLDSQSPDSVDVFQASES
ncbi:hypothetical protein JD844_027052 [Phrynosoma platyrhinos]|uniref:Uncharacterized protein n=1 Tax=Phrynosoma platyrhinos TaxID=52577 RepID=A0ABQ7SFM3_PHRPL|nr:hypothetical protein JD844_027052 [Phrynosoma platyrhinos]